MSGHWQNTYRGRYWVGGIPDAADYDAATSRADVVALNVARQSNQNVIPDRTNPKGYFVKGSYSPDAADFAYLRAGYKFIPEFGMKAGQGIDPLFLAAWTAGLGIALAPVVNAALATATGPSAAEVSAAASDAGYLPGAAASTTAKAVPFISPEVAQGIKTAGNVAGIVNTAINVAKGPPESMRVVSPVSGVRVVPVQTPLSPTTPATPATPAEPEKPAQIILATAPKSSVNIALAVAVIAGAFGLFIVV